MSGLLLCPLLHMWYLSSTVNFFHSWFQFYLDLFCLLDKRCFEKVSSSKRWWLGLSEEQLPNTHMYGCTLLKASIQFQAQSNNLIICYRKPVEGANEYAYILWFHSSAGLVSCSKWSDHQADSKSGFWPFTLFVASMSKYARDGQSTPLWLVRGRYPRIAASSVDHQR